MDLCQRFPRMVCGRFASGRLSLHLNSFERSSIVSVLLIGVMIGAMGAGRAARRSTGPGPSSDPFGFLAIGIVSGPGGRAIRDRQPRLSRRRGT